MKTKSKTKKAKYWALVEPTVVQFYGTWNAYNLIHASNILATKKEMDLEALKRSNKKHKYIPVKISKMGYEVFSEELKEEMIYYNENREKISKEFIPSIVLIEDKEGWYEDIKRWIKN